MTDKELEKIYNEAYRAVYWTAFSLLKNEADAEDVVQDTFVTLIESYDTIEDKTKVTAWLKKIAANKCLNRLTRTKTDAVEDEFFEDVEAVPEDFLPDTIVESADMRRIIMDIISKSLSEEIRRTLILFYFDEMSTKEIAEALGVPEGTVRRRLNFARNKIKKEVEKYEEENKTKLFGMAALPFLSQLFIKEAEMVPLKAMPASLIATLSASAKASAQGAGIKVAASAAKKGTGIMINKIVIGGIASAVAVGATVGVILTVVNKPEAKPETVETSYVSETEEATKKSSAAATESTTKASKEDYDGVYFFVDDMTPEEIVETYVYYHDKAHSIAPENYADFEQYLQVKPESFENVGGYSYMVHYSDKRSVERDHIRLMHNTSYTAKKKSSFAIEVVVFDEDRAQAIMDAYRDHYAVDGAKVIHWDSDGIYDDGYLIKIDKDNSYSVGYDHGENKGKPYYVVRLTELMK